MYCIWIYSLQADTYFNHISSFILQLFTFLKKNPSTSVSSAHGWSRTEVCQQFVECKTTFMTHHTFGPDKSVAWALPDSTEVVAAQLGSENCRNLQSGVFSLLLHLFTDNFINLPNRNINKNKGNQFVFLTWAKFAVKQ